MKHAVLCVFCIFAVIAFFVLDADAFTIKNSTHRILVGSVRTEQDNVVIFQFRLDPGEKSRYSNILNGEGYIVHVREERPSTERQAVGEGRVQTMQAYVEVVRRRGRLVIEVDEFTLGESGLKERRPHTPVFPLPEVRPPLPK